MRKKTAAAFLSAAMAVSIAAAQAQTVLPDSGMTVSAEVLESVGEEKEYGDLLYVVESNMVLITGCKDRSTIEEVTIPSSIDGYIVKQICGNAFTGCRKLRKVKIKMGTVYIGKAAFKGCRALENISLPTTLQFIDEYAFKNCTSIEKVKLPGSLQIVGKEAFCNTVALKRINVPENVLDIGERAFGFDNSSSRYGVTLGVYPETAGEEYAVSNDIDYVYLKKDIKDADIYVESPVVYNGKARKPSVVVSEWFETLLEGDDYKLAYSDNIKCGRAYVTVKGIGRYKGSVKKSFIIKPAKVKAKNLTSPAPGSVKLTWEKAKGGVTGYKVQLSPDKKFKKSVRTYTLKKSAIVSKRVSGLKSGRKYFVRVCAYKKVGKTNYKGAWSIVKMVKCK